MKRFTLAGTLVALCLLTASAASAVSDDATLFRVFLKDQTTLVSYGELARVGDRVVFSMPVGALTASAPNLPLRLVNIAADRVDWERTDRYAESARAAHYVSTQAESDYAGLSNEVARTLNEVATAPDAARRLALVEAARKTLAEWPRSHFNYRAGEVRQMLTMLDEAIADLRASSGVGRFDLSLAAYAGEPPILDALLPPPTPMEAIEATLSAARLSESAADRESLLAAALSELDRSASALPAAWTAATRAETNAALQHELRLDRAYQLLTRRTLTRANLHARAADVRSLERVLVSIQRGDDALGGKRPDAIAALIAAVQAQLDAVRLLRLARDRWALRAPVFRLYRGALAAPVDILGLFARVKPALEDIKALAGSSPAALAALRRSVARIVRHASAIVPPEEIAAAHALLVSAAQMADTAAQIRHEATLSTDIARAWDASSAAAGAMMLAARARSEIQRLLRPPQLQ